MTTILIKTKTGAVSQDEIGMLQRDLEQLGYRVAEVRLNPMGDPGKDLVLEMLPDPRPWWKRVWG